MRLLLLLVGALVVKNSVEATCPTVHEQQVQVQFRCTRNQELNDFSSNRLDIFAERLLSGVESQCGISKCQLKISDGTDIDVVSSATDTIQFFVADSDVALELSQCSESQRLRFDRCTVKSVVKLGGSTTTTTTTTTTPHLACPEVTYMSRAQFTVGCLQGRGLTDRDGDLLATRLTTSLVENCGIDACDIMSDSSDDLTIIDDNTFTIHVASYHVTEKIDQCRQDQHLRFSQCIVRDVSSTEPVVCESVVYDTPLQMEVACSRDRQLDNLLPIRDLDFFAFRLEQAVVNKCGGKECDLNIPYGASDLTILSPNSFRVNGRESALATLEQCLADGNFRFNRCTVRSISSAASITSSLASITEGIPDTMYSFDLEINGIPSSVSSVTLEWSFGVGSPGTTVLPVTGNTASHTISASYSTPGTYTITITAFVDGEELASLSIPVTILGVVISINPPGLTGGKVGELYNFTLTSSGFPSSLTEVTFNWNFGIDSLSSGEMNVAIVDGVATTTISRTYTSIGAFGLSASVISDKGTLAQTSVVVVIGETIERDNELSICDVWKAANQGGVGVTVDNWDISAIPLGAVFDIEYNAFGIPDKYVVEYPVGNTVLDTGWRGNPMFDGLPLYPGGVVGPGAGSELNIFSRLSSTKFRVTIFGPDPGTVWNYQIRCRIV